MTIDPKRIDVFPDEHDGYPASLAAEDTRDVLFGACGSASRDFPKALWIEPREWKSFAADVERDSLWPINYIDRFTNQADTHECTTHSLRANFESAWNRQRRVVLGPPEPHEVMPQPINSASVWVSQIGIYAEANPRQWGGANVRQVLEIALDRGFVPESKQPRTYPTAPRHVLHGTCGEGNECNTSGPWVPLSRFPSGWKETARHFRPLEVIFPETWEQIVCLVLRGRVVSVGRSGHAVPYAKWEANDQVMAYVDSYNVIRYDSVRTIKQAVSGAFSIESVTTPDNWDDPFGFAIGSGIAA